MKKILLLCGKFAPEVGGVQYSNLEVAKSLHGAGYDVTVLAPTINRRQEKEHDSRFPFNIKRLHELEDVNKRYKLGVMKMTPSDIIKTITRARDISKKIKQINKRQGFDTVLLADYPARFLYTYFPFLFPKKYSTIVSIPEDDANNKNPLKRIIATTAIKRFYKKSEKIIAVSSATADHIKRYYDGRKVCILPRTIAESLFTKKRDYQRLKEIKKRFEIKDHITLLSVGRLTKEKGIDKTINLVEKLIGQKFKIKYFIVGDGPEKDNLEKLAKEKGEREVVFLGRKEQEELADLYDLCDIAIMLSDSESFGRIFAEASARGKPSIGPKKGGASDIIEDGVSGYLVDSLDDNEVLEKTKIAIKNTRTLGKNAKKRSYKFSQEHQQEKLKQILG